MNVILQLRNNKLLVRTRNLIIFIYHLIGHILSVAFGISSVARFINYLIIIYI